MIFSEKTHFVSFPQSKIIFHTLYKFCPVTKDPSWKVVSFSVAKILSASIKPFLCLNRVPPSNCMLNRDEYSRDLFTDFSHMRFALSSNISLMFQVICFTHVFGLNICILFNIILSVLFIFSTQNLCFAVHNNIQLRYKLLATYYKYYCPSLRRKHR